MSEWTEHVARWKDCTKCPLCNQRDRICLARGQIPADVCFIGEAPGASEDAIGLPFVGPAGELLNQIAARAFEGLELRTVFANLVCCFPAEAKGRGENEPTKEEILACRPRLVEFVNIAKPRLIVCVGSLASDNIPHDAYGKVGGVSVISIMHPAAILRMPLAQKQMAVQKVVVTLRTGVEEMLTSGNQFTKWEVSDASTRTARQRLRATVEDQIP